MGRIQILVAVKETSEKIEVNKVEFNYRNISHANNFDFIRFLAAVAVVYSHSYDLTGIKQSEPLRIYSNGYISIGTLAVLIFFIVSGFLIKHSYEKSKSLTRYLLARCLRIFPALIVVTLITCFILGPILTKLTVSEYFKHNSVYSYLLNCFCLKIQYELPGVFENNPIKDLVNGTLWSLPYEFLFYILILLIAELKSKRILSGLILLGAICTMVYFIGFSYFTNIVHYAFYFLIGVGFHYYRNYISLKWSYAVIAFVFLGFLLVVNINVHLKHILLGVFLSYIIFTIAFVKSSLNSFAKHGDFSYGIYIWGMLIQQIIINYFPNISQSFNFLISTLIAIVVAFFSWHLLEKKALRLKSSLIRNS